MPERDEEFEARENERLRKIAAIQRSVDEGLKSGIGTASRDELFQRARASLDPAMKYR